MAPPSTIATSFLVISDTHNVQFDEKAGRSLPFQLPTPKVDVLLHCGDLTEVGGVSSFIKVINMLGKIDAELKLIIAGNHDLELDREYWETRCSAEENPEDPQDHDLALAAMTGKDATTAGVIFLNEGTHTFTLKTGAKFTIHVSPYTPAFRNWAFAYAHHEDRFNAPHQVAPATKSIATNPIPDDVDIVMTHGPPHGILDWCAQGNVGCPNLLQAIRRAKPTMHCFGHIHEGHGIEVIDWKKKNPLAKPAPARKNEAIHRFFEEDPIENPYPEPFVWGGAERGGRTLAVNAAIMTGGYKPENAPWLVRLDLPRGNDSIESKSFILPTK